MDFFFPFALPTLSVFAVLLLQFSVLNTLYSVFSKALRNGKLVLALSFFGSALITLWLTLDVLSVLPGEFYLGSWGRVFLEFSALLLFYLPYPFLLFAFVDLLIAKRKQARRIFRVAIFCISGMVALITTWAAFALSAFSGYG